MARIGSPIVIEIDKSDLEYLLENGAVYITETILLKVRTTKLEMGKEFYEDYQKSNV